ncbi:hypothetical protein ANTQUA_LOCUS2449 [Anthophora quadrimaculata]
MYCFFSLIREIKAMAFIRKIQRRNNGLITALAMREFVKSMLETHRRIRTQSRTCNILALLKHELLTKFRQLFDGTVLPVQKLLLCTRARFYIHTHTRIHLSLSLLLSLSLCSLKRKRLTSKNDR